MVSKFNDLSYKESFKEIGLLILQERREKGVLITTFILANNMERIDRKDLVTEMEEGERYTSNKGTLEEIKCSADIKETAFCIKLLKSGIT